MKKPLMVLIVFLVLIFGYHIYRRHSADFFYANGKIEKNKHWSFNEERYDLSENGFRVEKGNLILYTDEIFEKGVYRYKLRFLGFPIALRVVDYPNHSCWLFPGIPGDKANTEWLPKGEQRFKECLAIVDLYNQKSPEKESPGK